MKCILAPATPEPCSCWTWSLTGVGLHVADTKIRRSAPLQCIGGPSACDKHACNYARAKFRQRAAVAIAKQRNAHLAKANQTLMLPTETEAKDETT
jgi:hypothetical protein